MKHLLIIGAWGFGSEEYKYSILKEDVKRIRRIFKSI